MLIPTLEYGSYGGLVELFRKVPSFVRGIEECRNRQGDDGGTVLEDWSCYPIRSRCFGRVKVFQEWVDFSGRYRAETFKKATVHDVSMVYFAFRELRRAFKVGDNWRKLITEVLQGGLWSWVVFRPTGQVIDEFPEFLWVPRVCTALL